MDPNELLKRIRERVRDAFGPKCSDELYFLAEDFESLDSWLSHGSSKKPANL